MSLTTITVTGSYPAGAGNSVATGFVTFVPTARILNAAGHTIIPQLPVQVTLQLGALSLENVITTDNAGLLPTGWAWQVTENIDGVAAEPYYVYIPSTYGATVDLSELAEATPGPIITAYANLAAANTFTAPNAFSDGLTVAGTFELDTTTIASPPGGTTEYLRGDGTWDVPAGSGGGAVSSVFDRTGAVTAETGDYTFSEITGTATSGQLPAATTSAQGAVILNGTAADIQPVGSQAAGSIGKVADAGHVHPNTGLVLTAQLPLSITSGGTGADSLSAAGIVTTSSAASTVQAGTSYGAATAAGTDTTYAREDHQHGTPALTSSAPATIEGIGQGATVGTATTPARADHVHPLAAAGTPGNSAVGNTAAAGVSTSFAAADHQHGRESFGTVTAQTGYGAASGTGTATTVAHSDHAHGTPALTTTAPAATLAIGTAAALGSATLPALADHVHPMAAAATPSNSAVTDSAATGNATTFAASNHIHGREGFGAVTALAAFNTASATGTAATVSHSDHVHGAPALPSAAVSVAGLVTPPGGTTTFLRADATWATPTGAASTVYSRQIVIAADGLPSTITPPVGTWTPTYLMTSDTGGVWSGWVNVSGAAQNDQVSFDLACGAGTYTIELLNLAYTNRGIYTIEIDGASVGTIDGYATSLTAARSQLPGVVITAGAHVLTLLMATKNASSSGYVALVERLVLTQTA